MREYVQVKLLHSILLKTPLTFPWLLVNPWNSQTCEWFYILRAASRLCQFSSVEDSQMGDLRPPLMTLIWDLPAVSYSIVSHYSDTHEPYFSLKGIANSSVVRPGTHHQCCGTPFSQFLLDWRGKQMPVGSPKTCELHRNKFVSGAEKWKTSRAW